MPFQFTAIARPFAAALSAPTRINRPLPPLSDPLAIAERMSL